MLDENIFDKEGGEINVSDRLSGSNICLEVRNTEFTKQLEEKNIIIKEKEKILEQKEKTLSEKEEIIKNLQNEVVGVG